MKTVIVSERPDTADAQMLIAELETHLKHILPLCIQPQAVMDIVLKNSSNKAWHFL